MRTHLQPTIISPRFCGGTEAKTSYTKEDLDKASDKGWRSGMISMLGVMGSLGGIEHATFSKTRVSCEKGQTPTIEVPGKDGQEGLSIEVPCEAGKTATIQVPREEVSVPKTITYAGGGYIAAALIGWGVFKAANAIQNTISGLRPRANQ